MTNISSKMNAPTDYDEHELDLLNPDELFDWLGQSHVNLQSDGEQGGDSLRRVKVAKNDIRRFIPKMFLSAINGGNFQHAQTFADSFIAPQCHVTAFFNIPPHFHMPSQVFADGPIQFGHYILGYLIMFPDMVMTLSETSILSSPDTPGSKIIMDVEYSLTKTAHIPYELWIPSLDLIESLYRADTGWQLLHIIRHPHLYRSPASRLILPSSSSEDLTDRLNPALSLSGESLDPGDYIQQQQGAIYPSTPPPELNAPASITSAAPAPAPTPTPAPAPAPVTSILPTRVPDRFARALLQAASPVFQPMSLQLRGQVTFHLDETNHVVLMETHVTAV